MFKIIKTQKMKDQKIIRHHLEKLLKGGNAFVPLEKAIENIPFEKLGVKPSGLPYSLWGQAEHIRISQKDIRDFSIGTDYQEIKWPDDYWPSSEAPKNEDEWQLTVSTIKNDLKSMIKLVNDESRDLFEPFSWGNGQTLFREAVLVAEHNAYHTGQILVVRRLLGIW